MNYTSLIGKQVYSLYEGEIIGTVFSIALNNNYSKIKSIKLFDSDEMEYIINFTDIKNLSDFVLITNKSKINPSFAESKYSPFGKQVVDMQGKNCGQIVDAVFDNRGNIEKYLTNTKQNIPSQFLYFKKDFVVFSENKIQLCNYKPKEISENLENIKVKILKIDEKNDEIITPKKITYNTNQIIGKKAKSDVYGFNNELIIKTNQTITEKVVEDAIKHARLNQLYFVAI